MIEAESGTSASRWQMLCMPGKTSDDVATISMASMIFSSPSRMH
jgi:hypothetical protein